jgi:putative transposase
MSTNKRRRHTPEQIIRKPAEGNKHLGTGQQLDEVCRHLEIAESTWHRWVAQYGGMKANDAKRIEELKGEKPASKNSLPTPSWTRTCCRRSRRETSDHERASVTPSRCCATVSRFPNDEPAPW